MFGKVQWVDAKRQIYKDQKSSVAIIPLPGQQEPLKFYVKSRTGLGLTVRCSRCCLANTRRLRMGQHQLPVATMRIDGDDQWRDDPLDVHRHCCGLQPVGRANMGSPAAKPGATPVPMTPKRQRSCIPSSTGKIFSPTTSFGEVSWARGKFNGLSPYIPLPGQQEPLRFVVSNRGSDGQINIKCNRCVIHTVRNRKNGVKGMPMFLFTIKDNQWVHRNPLASTWHCCGFNLPKTPSPVKSIGSSPVQYPAKPVSRSAPHPQQPQPSRSRKPSLNKSLPSTAATPNFGNVLWMLGKRGAQVAYIDLPDQPEPVRFCVSAVNQGPEGMSVLKCSWCMTLCARSRSRGNGSVRVVNYKVVNNQWVQHDPLDVKGHCCRLQPPTPLRQSQGGHKSPEKVPPVVEEIVEVDNNEAESPPLDLTIDGDMRKDIANLETFGEVEWTEKQKVCLRLANQPHPITFHVHFRRSENVLWVKCANCAHLNAQRKLRGLSLPTKHVFTIKNNVWVGRDPRDPKWHGCRLQQVKYPRKTKAVLSRTRSVKRTLAKNVAGWSNIMSPVSKSPVSQPSSSTADPLTSLNSSIQWKKNRETGQKYAFIEATPQASTEKVCFTFAKCVNEEDNTYSMSCLKCVHVNKRRLLEGHEELPIPNIKVVDQKWCEDPANPTVPHICFTQNRSSRNIDRCAAVAGTIDQSFMADFHHPNATPSQPKNDFGPVYWSPSFSKQDCLVVLAKSRLHPSAIYKFYIPTQYRGQTPFYARCSYCETENTKRRASNKASLPITKVAIQGDRWLDDPDQPGHPHFCLQRARQPPAEIFEEVDGALLDPPSSTGAVRIKQEFGENSIDIQRFGPVQWKPASLKQSTAMAIVRGGKVGYEFMVMHREQDKYIVRCYYCTTTNQNRGRRGETLLPTPHLVIHNNQWVGQDPLNPTIPHICIPREALVVQHQKNRVNNLVVKSTSRRTRAAVECGLASADSVQPSIPSAASADPTEGRDIMQACGSASPTNLSTPEPKRRRVSSVPNPAGVDLSTSSTSSGKKRDFGEVDWQHTRAESLLAVAHHNGQQLSFCIAHRTYSGVDGSFAIGTCIAQCLECKLVNQQRIKAGLPLLLVPQLKIVNSRWQGQHPFSPLIPHFCALSLATTSVEEEVEVVQEDIASPPPSAANTSTANTSTANTSMARPTSRKSALRIASTKTRRSPRGADKENSGSATRQREPRSAAKNAMNALLSLSLTNRRNKKSRSVLEEKQNMNENTPIRSYKLVLQNSVINIEDEESEVETFDTNELTNLRIANGSENRIQRKQSFGNCSIICISDDDEVPEEEVRELPSRKCKRTSIEDHSRAGSSSSVGSNLFVRDLSSTTSPTDSYFSALGESAEEGALLQHTSSTEEVEEEEVEEEHSFDEKDREDGIYEVDKVLAVRHNAGREMEYLLKWKNYAYSVSTWEKSQFVVECKELIAEFTKRERLREMIAASMKASERPLYSQGHTASAFFSLQRWEDEMNEVLIANGQAPLLVENWVDTYGRPKNFKFITSNILTAGALAIMEHPKIVPCLCLQGCISSKECCPDVICYTSNNRIRKNFNFDENWLVECSDECACGIDCQTKVVQRGRRIPVIIFRTVDRGWSVRTAAKIPNNTFVMEYVGEVVTMEESKFIKSATYQFDMDACGADKCAFVVDAMHNGNEARFVNHSCDPNMIVRGVFCDRMDNRYLRLAFFAIKDIEKGEEITINYFSKMDNNAYAKKTKNRTQKSCFCKTKNCRGYIV